MFLRYVCGATAFFLAVLTAFIVWALSAVMAPVHDGSATDFVEALCRADFDGDEDWVWAEAYYVDDQWCAYDVVCYHGSYVCRVPTAEVERLLPEVSAKIETNSAEGLRAFVMVAHAEWRDSTSDRSVARLVGLIRAARNRLTYRRKPQVLACFAWDEFVFRSHWPAAGFYWARVLFDWAFLSAWCLFLLWPGIVGARPWQRRLHRAAAPPLFLVPLYLGYASFSFTCLGPNGGVLYPILVRMLPSSPTLEIDEWLLSHTPLLLEGISTPIGTPRNLTGLDLPGITGYAIFGVIAGGGPWIGYHFLRWLAEGYFPRCTS